MSEKDQPMGINSAKRKEIVEPGEVEKRIKINHPRPTFATFVTIAAANLVLFTSP